MSESEHTRAVVVHARGDLRVDAVPAPHPDSNEALVAIERGGICGSDLHYWLHGAAGESILRDPLVLGHEVVGRVRRAATDGSGPTAGVRVAVHPATGGSYLGSAAARPHQAGAFADLVALPTRMLRPIPESLDPRTAALIEPLSVAWHAVRRAGDVRGRRVLVVGAGPIGALVVTVLVHHGAAEIVVTDVYEAPRERALALGATRALAAGDSASIEALDVDVSIESSGSAAGLGAALRATARGGRVVMVGLLPPGDQPVAISWAITREIDLIGSYRFTDEIDEVITALASGAIDPSAVVTHEFDADDALAAFEVARDSSSSGKVLLRFGGDAS